MKYVEYATRRCKLRRRSSAHHARSCMLQIYICEACCKYYRLVDPGNIQGSPRPGVDNRGGNDGKRANGSRRLKSRVSTDRLNSQLTCFFSFLLKVRTIRFRQTTCLVQGSTVDRVSQNTVCKKSGPIPQNQHGHQPLCAVKVHFSR